MREQRNTGGRFYNSGDFMGEGEEERGPLAAIMRIGRAVGEGVLPIVILAALVALFWEASVIGRIFTAPYGIDVLQRTEAVTAGGGLLVTLVVFFVTISRTIRGMRENHHAGYQIEALVTLVCLAITAIIVLYPVLAALATPQHPAP